MSSENLNLQFLYILPTDINRSLMSEYINWNFLSKAMDGESLLEKSSRHPCSLGGESLYTSTTSMVG
jgi:hypothetical protein